MAVGSDIYTAPKGNLMPKQEWGVKRICPETARRFYDLNANPIISPYTGKEYALSFFTQDKSKTTMADKEDKATLQKAKEAEIEDNADVLDDSDDSKDVNASDDVLDEEEEDTVNLEEIAAVPATEDEET